MIKKLLQRAFTSKHKNPALSPHLEAKRYPRAKHGIDRQHISSAALKTVHALHEAGFAAFIVGGAVRDLILQHQPKDFDIATDATPEQVRKLFRRSRIIGRRFRLVHVILGNEVVEVSTFRRSHLADNGESQVTESGRILSDNVFGSHAEDALRRDFTANALYYDPESEEVWDFVRGLADIQDRVLRIIGDPEIRYREDPVRMLRAVRLSAKLGFRLHPHTEKPIPHLTYLLQDVPAARLFDEMLKLFLSGHAMESAHALRAHGLHHGLLPMLDMALDESQSQRFVTLALKNTDERVLANKPVSPAFLFACLLWHEVVAAWQRLQAAGESPIPALVRAMHEVVHTQAEKLAISRRYSVGMMEIWALQPRFEQRSGQRPYRLLENPRFRAGYDFLLLRCQSGEAPMELAQWWDRFAQVDAATRAAMLLPDTAQHKRRRRSRRKPAAAVASA